MAKRRCINIELFENEKFLELSDKSKILYFGLMLHSDDEGFIINPMSTMRLLKKQKKYFDELIENGYIMQVDDVYVIKHWYAHNRIPPSKRLMTKYYKQHAKLKVNFSGEYVFAHENSSEDSAD